MSFVTFGAALEPVFGGIIFWVAREMAKVVENELISPDSVSSSSEDILKRLLGYMDMKWADLPNIYFKA